MAPPVGTHKSHGINIIDHSLIEDTPTQLWATDCFLVSESAASLYNSVTDVKGEVLSSQFGVRISVKLFQAVCNVMIQSLPERSCSTLNKDQAEEKPEAQGQTTLGEFVGKAVRTA